MEDCYAQLAGAANKCALFRERFAGNRFGTPGGEQFCSDRRPAKADNRFGAPSTRWWSGQCHVM